MQIAYALQLLASLPQLIQAGIDVTALVMEGQAKLKEMQAQGREPTAGEWDDLNDRISALRGELHG